MDDLVQFLRARLDEEQTEAEAASPGPWTVNAEGDEVLAVDGIAVADGFALSGRQLRATTAHIARHDPDAVLRRVEAWRRLLFQFEQRGNSVRAVVAPSSGGVWDDMLRLLALPYADHDDYRPEWRP